MSLMHEPQCRREADAVAKTLSFMDDVRREICLDHLSVHVFRGLVEGDGWASDDAGEFVRDLRKYLEVRIVQVEAIYLPG